MSTTDILLDPFDADEWYAGNYKDYVQSTEIGYMNSKYMNWMCSLLLF